MGRQNIDLPGVQFERVTETFTLPCGTVCHRNGIPFKLAEDTLIQATPANWPLISEEFKPQQGFEQGRFA